MIAHLRRRHAIFPLALAAVLAATAAACKQGSAAPPSPPAAAAATAPPMQGMPGMPEMGSVTDDASANGVMAHEHMAMGSHMKMTAPRPPTAADARRAAAIVETVRDAIAKYRDYRVAEADHFVEFLPKIRQPMYHFTNYAYSFKEQFRFDPTRPTSLLYKPAGEGFELVGAMFTAPRHFSEEQLDARVPLSVASWHQHVNLCMPRIFAYRTADWTRFGLQGTISTAGECQASGGVFHPVVLGWMVHVYPFEKDPAQIWAQ